MMKLDEYDKIFSEFSYKNMIQRELNSCVSLDTDLFDKPIEEIKKRYIKKINKSSQKIKDISNEFEETPRDDVGRPSEKEIQFYDKLDHFETKRYWLEEELKTLNEMQIIHTFKNLEINIKLMIEIAYKDSKTKDFYRWDILVSFLKSKNINVHCLTGHQEVLELKRVNNSIKHNGRLNKEITSIQEFNGLENYTADSLNKFHLRVKEKK